MESILQEKDGTCYLCQRLHGNYNVHSAIQEHHIFFGTANRKLSEKYGLKAYLCIQHHTGSNEAVHQNAENATLLKREAQEVFERTHTREEFMEIFGKNWLEDVPVQQPKEEMRNAAGFQILPGEEALLGMGKAYGELEKRAERRKSLC